LVDARTRTVRAGMESDDVTGAVVPPIHLTSTFAFRGYGAKRTYDYSRCAHMGVGPASGWSRRTTATAARIGCSAPGSDAANCRWTL
jgi:cystathionine beta-lyase/cystathionine gamma-synthase